jgi:hypothetical protein
VVLLFSILFTSTALAAFASLILVVAGRFSDVIRNMKEVAPGAPAWLIQGLYYALPNYRNFDFKDRVGVRRSHLRGRPRLGRRLRRRLRRHRPRHRAGRLPTREFV